MDHDSRFNTLILTIRIGYPQFKANKGQTMNPFDNHLVPMRKEELHHVPKAQSTKHTEPLCQRCDPTTSENGSEQFRQPAPR
ncbi:hypothetical protein XNA1_390028 [Xenorhabdus nematophila str. Anatoliense]|nr:hypothetical protein XNA1_1960028 [Xenorhabdus nematophila str. Anatoliense]CEE93532.1 hypothetical protein XNA1_390028 [Xenorhabdus nematophila str. Anatoliense]